MDLPVAPKTPIARRSSARFGLSLGKFGSQELLGSSMRRQSSGYGSDFSNPTSPRPNQRCLPSRPCDSLDIPDLPSDFYISPIDWSKDDVIAVVSNGSLALHDRKRQQENFYSLAMSQPTSVRFSANGENLAIGDECGEVRIYSMPHMEEFMKYDLFDTTVLCSDWYDTLLVSGSRDGSVGVVDVRENSPNIHTNMHREEICAVKFANDGMRIATSSNDCSVKIWDVRNIKSYVSMYTEHNAAVRAMHWSPMEDDVIATGGGTSDKTIRIWHVYTGETICHVDTGSQVCNLLWNGEYNEILSTHGFSQNQVALWRASDLMPIAQFHEHKQRVLYMAASPDQTRVATAAPSDSILIWKMFPSKRPVPNEDLGSVR